MRVGVLTTSYPRFDDDSAGGFVAGFSGWLAEQGHEVDVVCARGDRSLFYRGGAPLALRSSLRAWGPAAHFSIALARTAWRRRASWDAVVAHWLVPAALVALPLGLPLLAIAHGSDIALLRRLPGGAALVRQVARRADLVYVARALVVDGAAGRVVSMGVAQAPMATAGERATIRRALGCDDRPVILFLGRLIDDKGVDLAIAARPSSAQLVIAGEGPAEDSLRRLAAAHDDVRFVGAVHGGQKRQWLAAADLLVVPSRVDAAPVVVSEALVAGVPVVATRVGGLIDLVDHGNDGILCEPTVSSLGAALQAALADRERLAEGARATGRTRGWDVVAPRLWEPFCARASISRPTIRGVAGRLRVSRC